jgi:hypothetical protein
MVLSARVWLAGRGRGCGLGVASGLCGGGAGATRRCFLRLRLLDGRRRLRGGSLDRALGLNDLFRGLLERLGAALRAGGVIGQ